MLSLKYWQTLEKIIVHAKKNIPKEFRIDDACFTSFVTIGENLFIRHPKKLNNIYKHSKDLMSVIITLIPIVNCEEYCIKWNDY